MTTISLKDAKVFNESVTTLNEWSLIVVTINKGG